LLRRATPPPRLRPQGCGYFFFLSTLEDVMSDEPSRTPGSGASTEERSALSTKDFTAEGRQGGPSQPDATGNQALDEGAGDEWEVRLFSDSDRDHLRHRWEKVQEQFVDEPKAAVQDADALVAETIQSVAETFSSARSELEDRWSRGDDVSTEDLRVTLQQYRSFFNRLLEG
jgi:hypothetical protein